MIARIVEILGYIDCSELVGGNNEILELFSDAELKEILYFLEQGDYAKLAVFVQNKLQEVKDLEGKAKNLQGKVQVEKLHTAEKQEQQKEEQELENLLTFD
ncbi:hypothetical protein KGV52_00465 [Candidatus Gracilibacteria bacterium]|nr:hypothetical protein [Candidatus Gracilibacteria bacterium]